MKMWIKIWKVIMILSIIGLIFSTISLVKFKVVKSDYSQFLTDVIDYDTQILETMNILQKEMPSIAIQYGEMSIGMEHLNTWWYFDIFDWTETSFATPDALEKLNYWRETGQLPEPENSKTDFNKGIQSV